MGNKGEKNQHFAGEALFPAAMNQFNLVASNDDIKLKPSLKFSSNKEYEVKFNIKPIPALQDYFKY